eukprot:3376158-Karenia_brevis.AAC.1
MLRRAAYGCLCKEFWSSVTLSVFDRPLMKSGWAVKSSTFFGWMLSNVLSMVDNEDLWTLIKRRDFPMKWL